MKNLNISLLLLFALFSCSDKDKIHEVYIQEQIRLGIEKRIAEKHKECFISAMDSASRVADSIVTAKMTALDTSILHRPAKPTKPIIKSPLDTTPVEPILSK
jgi:hypothetical protein